MRSRKNTITGIFIGTPHQTAFAGPFGPAETGSFFRLLKNQAESAYHRRRDGGPKHRFHPFSPFHDYLISFRLNPYRPTAVQTMTQNAPTTHALPR